MAIGANSEIYVLINCVVYDLSTNCTTVKEHHLFLSRSVDGGNTFSFVHVDSQGNPLDVPRVNPILRQDAYAAFPTANKRTNFGSIATLPSGAIGMVWPCDSGVDIDICFQLSLDRGETWLPNNLPGNKPMTVNDDNTNPDGSTKPAYHILPAIVGDSNLFHVIWIDSRATGLETAPADWGVFRSDLINTGQALIFTPNALVSNGIACGNDMNSSPKGFGDFFEISSLSNKIYSVWSDDSAQTNPRTADVYFRSETMP